MSPWRLWTKMASKKGKEKKAAVAIKDADVQPAVTELREIVKGRMNEQEWKDHLKEEESCEAVGEVLWEVVDCAWEIIYHNWVQQEIYPYAVQDARTKLLEAVRWNFLSYDKGEKDIASNPSWYPDEEPKCSPVDTWARGMVPVVRCRTPPQLPPTISQVSVSSSTAVNGKTLDPISLTTTTTTTTSRDHINAKSGTQSDGYTTTTIGPEATRSPVGEERRTTGAELNASQLSSSSIKKKVSKKRISADKKIDPLPCSGQVVSGKVSTMSTTSQTALTSSASQRSKTKGPSPSHVLVIQT